MKQWTVADVMTAARRMEHNGVKRMPVVDAAGRMVGIVSRRDLLRMHPLGPGHPRRRVGRGADAHGFTFGEPDDLVLPGQD